MHVYTLTHLFRLTHIYSNIYLYVPVHMRTDPTHIWKVTHLNSKGDYLWLTEFLLPYNPVCCLKDLTSNASLEI